jgi:hypothetical protein
MWSKKNLGSSAVESMRHNIRDYETGPNISSPNINSELLLMSGFSCGIWNYVTPNMSVMEISIPFLVKPVSSVSACCRRNDWKIIGVSENQADLELRPVAKRTRTETLHGEHAILLRAPRSADCIRRSLVREIYTFQEAPFHNCSSVSASSALYRRSANSTGVPHATINVVKRE